VDSEFSATPFEAKISNAEQLYVRTMLVIDVPQSTKAKAEVIADILGSITAPSSWIAIHNVT